MCQFQCVEGVLFHQEHGEAFGAVQFLDRLEDELDDEGREAQRRLVEQEQARTRHQGAGDCQHLLLAARQRTAALRLALLEDGKHLEGAGDILVEKLWVAHRGAHLQILEHGHAREYAAALGRLRDAELGNLVDGRLGDVLAVEVDRTGARARRAANCHHQGRLARTVGADEGDDLPGIDVHVDALERLDLAVEGLNTPDLEKGFGHAWSPTASATALAASASFSSSSSSTPR